MIPNENHISPFAVKVLTGQDIEHIKRALQDMKGTSIINEKVGVKENSNKLNYELDWDFIELMARRMAENKKKYGPYNWHKPIDKEELAQALLRHTLAVIKGNTEDDGQEYGHLVAVALNAMMLYYQIENY